MGIRQALTEKPAISLGLAVGLIVMVLVILLW
jgi:hypothetical protein